ncbi:MAG TPA: TetR/AcrR family transcriptional regulator [Longimicrobiales bacterium]|nr:TetR/AcrR family transcriptional regulator [Longimicrobiales bacterium]
MARKRTYTKRARAAGEKRTRASIIGATLALWAEAGPAATTISEIARRASVQRLTVYRHFEDDATLAAAAWAAFLDQQPRPDPADWAAIGSQKKRLRRALRNVYAYYTRAGDVLANVLHDAPRVPALEEAVAGHEHWLDGVVATLEPAWKPRGGKRDASLPVMLLEHAAMLSTWRSLGRAGLDERGAARFIERCMRGLARKGTKTS